MPERKEVNPLLGDERTRIVRVRASAVVDLSWDSLAASGWDLATVSASQIQIWHQGRQIPAQVTAAGISFVAGANTGPYSVEAAYWLSAGAEPGMRTILPGRPVQALSWAPDVVYQPVAPTMRGDRWFAGELHSTASPLTAELVLPATLPAGSRIDLAITPIEVGRHTLAVDAGEMPIGQVSWQDTGGGPRQISFRTLASIPAGHTTLHLTLKTVRPDVVLLDGLTIPGVQLALPHIAPAIEQPRPMAALDGADQLIVAHPDLAAALAPLVEAKARQGRTTTVADVLALYDAYSWGERDPEAIRAYIAALITSQRRPRSVLLFGAGTARMRVMAPGEAELMMIPPYLLDIDPLYGEVACDTCYTRLDAADPRADPLPDIPIGRLPARTLDEAQVLVAKTLSALEPPPGAWRDRALLVADNDRDAGGSADSAGPFTPLLDQIAVDLPTMGVERLAYTPNLVGDDGSGSYRSAPTLRSRLFRAWDDGVGLIAYVGHASPWQWAFTGPDEPVSHLLARSDAVRANGTRLPILLSLTCLSGAFANPTLTSIDEELLRQLGGGVAAALSPGGSGVNTGHHTIAHATLQSLRHGNSLGDAHLAGLAALLASPDAHELAYSYAILGDPELQLPSSTTSGYTIDLPVVTR